MLAILLLALTTLSLPARAADLPTGVDGRNIGIPVDDALKIFGQTETAGRGTRPAIARLRANLMAAIWREADM